MFNLDYITTKNNDKDWSFRLLVIGPSVSGKTNYLLNKIQTDSNVIDKIYLHSKDLDDDIYDDINDYNKKRKRKVLIVFDDMISHVMSNKKAQR